MRFNILGIILISLSIFSCVGSDNEILPGGTGKSGDLLVVMDSAFWRGSTGESIARCFAATQDGLPQREPYFNVIKVTPKNFTRIFKTTKNIIIVGKASGKESAKYAIQENIWAKNQLVLSLFTESDEKAASILSKNCESLRSRFMLQEYKRLQKAYEKLKSTKTMAEVEEVVGSEFTIPADYIIAAKKEDVIWLRKDFQQEGHPINMGLIIYQSSYQSEDQLKREWLMNKRDEITKIVEGPVPGSYMKHYEELEPISRDLTINKRFVRELRGLWNMENAFMGGPFVHYAFIDKTGKRLICVDGYVFAPKFEKREFLRELEAVALSALN